MPDNFTNARPYFDVTFPTSGDGFSISKARNAFAGLGFLDVIPLQPRAHNPADTKIMIRGRDASGFFNPVYYGDANQRIPFLSGDTTAFSTPVSNPRIDIVYMTPSGDLKIQVGTEAAVPTLPTLAPSGDSRFPICAVWNKTTQARIVNFEDKDSNSGDGYIYQDLRPWMRSAGAGAAKLGVTTPVAPTGDSQAGPGILTTAAPSDHVHGGVHAVRKVGSSNLQGDIEFAGSVSQSGNRITANSVVLQKPFLQTNAQVTLNSAIPDDATPPLSNEGVQILTLNITPNNALNFLHITGVAHIGRGANEIIILSIFNTSTLIGTHYTGRNTSDTGNLAIPISVWMVAGTTSQMTINVRAGAGSGGTVYFNGDASGNTKMGGFLYSTLQIEEIMV